MSITTCLRKAGPAINAEDKAAILKAAAAYRKSGMKADEAGRKAVDERIAAVQGMLADRERQVAEAPGGVTPTAPTAPVLQNRDRSNPAAISQMRGIAAAPDYTRLGFSRDFVNGAPVVAGGTIPEAQMGREDLVSSGKRRINVRYAVVESADVLASNSVDGTANRDYATATDRTRAIAGNGRMAGLQEAYRIGTAQTYRDELAADALHGIDPKVIAGMKRPVLVRVMPADQVTNDIGDESNTTGTLELSATEQARNDARRVNLDALEFSDDGAVTPQTVRRFVQAMPQAEQGGLIDTDGSPTRQAVDRLNAAVFATAYDSDALVRLYAQATDPEARNVMSALAQAAPNMARLRGAGDLDIRPLVTQAAEQAVNARRRGIKLADMAAQADLDTDPDVAIILRLFATNARSVKPIVDALNRAADFAYREASKDDTDMFGEVTRANRADVLAQTGEANDARGPQDLEVTAGRAPAGQDAVRRPQGPGRQANGGRAEEDGKEGDAAEGLTLEAQTAEDLQAKADREEAATKAAASKKAAEQERLRKEAEARDLKARADATVDDFRLGQDANRQMSGMGDMFADAPPRDMLPPSTSTEAAAGAKRTRPRGTVVFKRPIVGADGNRLLSYSWQWKPFEYVDNRGEERVARVSDWDNSETSAETGREVVHQFTVDVDGKEQTVSAEGALRLLGFLSGERAANFKSLSSAAKTLARLRMQQSELEAARDAFDADMAAVMKMPLPPMPTAAGKRGTMDGWWKLGDAEVRQLEPGALLDERKRLLISEWRNNRMAERGGWRNASMRAQDFATQLSLLQKRIDKQQAKIDSLVAAEPAPASATTDAQQASTSEAEAEGAEAAGPIEDVGEKIGGARKDMESGTGRTGRKAADDDRPAWARRFKISQIVTPGGMVGEVKDAGRWVINDSRSLDWMGKPKQVGRSTFATKEEAEAFVPIAAVGLKHRVGLASVQKGEPDKYEIWREVSDRKRVKVVDQQFSTRDEAMRYMAENAVAILETNTTFGEADMPLPPDRRREGPTRRTGDVTGQDFKDTFGLRGVEFGNWNNQDERQSLMNDAWDGLMDLADIMGIPPKAIGLNGDLALAFGARGHGLMSARAHYERNRAVINLTKERGAGSLAHEWFHALDHYFGRQDGKAAAQWEVQKDGTRTLKAADRDEDYVSHGFGRQSKVRPELRAAYDAVIRTMTKKAESYVEDTARVDKFTGTAREELKEALARLRQDLAEQKDTKYWKRNNKPAPAELLAEFDALAKSMLEGDVAAITTDWRLINDSKAKVAARYTNDALERMSAIYKQVRGRSGFDGTNRQGVLDRLRGHMTRYSERLKMLADAQSGAEKTRMVPTSFAMNARELDQGRGGDYWTTPHEMAARAFQGYVEDKIAERGGVSRFLNYGPENVGILTPWGFKRPFPTGDERKAINGAFDKFVGELKTRTDDAGNVAMFRRAEQKSREAAARIERNGGVTSPDDLRDLMGVPGYGLRSESAIAGDVDASAALSAELREAFPSGDWKAPRLGGRGIVTIQSDWLAGLGSKQSESLNRLSEILGRYDAPAIVSGPSTVDADALKGAGFVRYRGMQEMGARGNVAGASSVVGIAWIKEGSGISQVTPLYRRAPDTEAFRKWFGDSKVVDENGEPLVVYHGTTADLSEFDLGFAGSDGVAYSRPAIFATDDTDLASDYARNKHNRNIADAGRKFQRYKNENPGQYDQEYEDLFEAYKAAGRKEGWDNGGGANVLPIYMSLQNPLVVDGGGQRFMQVMPDAVKKATDGGHDGVIVRSVIDHASPASEYPATVYVAFRPEQIKSATGNRGTFDPADPDIRMRRGPKAEAKLTDVQQAVDAIKDTWANPPEVSVVWDLQDSAVDERIRAEDARQRMNGATGTPLAVYDRGVVYIVASAANSDMDVARSLFHEALGHAGLRAAFGDSLKPMLAQMVKTNRAAVEAKAKEYGLDMGNEADALRAAEEVLAELAETRPTSTWVKRAIAAIRQWLRDNLPGIFGDMQLSDADIVAQFIVPARDAIVRGQDAVSIGDGRLRGAGRVVERSDGRPGSGAPSSNRNTGAGRDSALAAGSARDGQSSETVGMERGSGIRFMRDGDESTPFFSGLSRAVERADMKAAGAQGWKMFLKGQIAKGAIKQDEVTWSGVEEWLDMQPGKVSREAVADYLRANGVRVTETQSPPGESIGTQDFRHWQLPGGTRYREVLLTLPGETANQRLARWKQKYPDWKEGQSYKAVMSESDQAKFLAELDGSKKEYRSGHWDQPNILAHIRVNDRTDADGKRVLFVEEIQSDYAKDARRKGLNTDMIPQSREWFDADTLDTLPTEAEAQAKRTELMPFLERNREPGMETRLVVKRDGDLWSVIEQSRSATDTAPNRGGVPPAPFIDKTDKWVALALKRVIKMAVDEGYDKVAFVTGEQSAERYDLSKRIESIEWSSIQPSKTYPQGRRLIKVQPVDAVETTNASVDVESGKIVSGFGEGRQLEDAVGKDIATRILETEEDALEGLDLKVGGEGMRAFYDQIVPSVAKEVLRKVGGGKMGSATITTFKAGTPGYGDLNDTVSDQPAFDITPAMREKASGGLPLFRRGGADAGKTAAQDLVNAKGGIFDFNRLGETKQDRVRTVIDGAREFWLGGLTRDQIADVYGDEITPVRDYDNLTRLMENERQKRAQDADKLYTEWAKLDEATNDKLGRIMLDATVYQVHPDETDPPAKADGKARIIHARIRREYEALPQEARDIYGKVKAFHQQTLADLQAAVEARIDRQVENGQAKSAALTNVRKMFDQYLEGGPYFPLSRFGDYIVIGKRESDGEKVVAAYETAGEQQAAARALEADGFTVKTKTAKTYSRQMDGAAGKFIGDVMQAVEKLDMVEATVNGSRSDLKNQLLDDLNQMFIRALPDLSYRKHFLHRKNTPGFSADVMRGFASSAFHAASHIARLNHGDQMTFALSDAYQAVENAPEGDFNKHVQVLNELAKRHDIALNPNTHPIAALLNQVGFVMYLGLSPAAGLVNLLQTPMVTLPHLGARYGFGKASAALGKATKDIMAAPMNKQSGWDATASDKLTAAEKKAMAELQDEGIIDLTQAHDLAAASGLDTGNVARSKAAFAMARAMKIVGWTFHVPEVMNRQATALSAYRLEMDASGDVDKAKDAAREAIKRTHFDYSSSNRARYFQGNIARVVLQFKQYAQNMTYLLGRSAQQALQGETPEVRSIARRQLVATLGATWAMAGTLGLPALGAVMGAIGSMVDMLDDDDEPWDWKVEFRNLMADSIPDALGGKKTAEVIAHGLPRALMPWDFSSRVGMGELWFRSNDREGQSPREAYATDIANILGPTAGTALGWYTAADHMQRGAYDKAVEAIVPKFIRDPLKAYRESTEGVTTYTGEPAMETTAAEEIGRLLGFAPANVSEMYEAKGAVMNAKTAIEEKRETLLGAVVKARLAKDADAEREARDEIRAFNKRNPRQAITSESIRRSLRNRQRNRDNREAGILLPESQEYLRERGRFAVTQ